MYESACCQVGVFLFYALVLAAHLRGRMRRGCLVKLRILLFPFSMSLSFVPG